LKKFTIGRADSRRFCGDRDRTSRKDGSSKRLYTLLHGSLTPSHRTATGKHSNVPPILALHLNIILMTIQYQFLQYFVKKILTVFPLENWRRPPVHPRTTWIKTIQQDLKSNNLSLNEAIDVAQNHPLWRLMSTFGAMHS